MKKVRTEGLDNSVIARDIYEVAFSRLTTAKHVENVMEHAVKVTALSRHTDASTFETNVLIAVAYRPFAPFSQMHKFSLPLKLALGNAKAATWLHIEMAMFDAAEANTLTIQISEEVDTMQQQILANALDQDEFYSEANTGGPGCCCAKQVET